jgi:hypothetical protein
MADRPFLVRVGWAMVIVAAGFGLACSERTPAPPPSTAPATTPAPDSVARPPATSPAVNQASVAQPMPTASATPSATATPAAAPSPSTSPTPDPAEAQRKQQEEQRIRSELAAAKATADTLTNAANTECPDLKPGELRHPGAVAHCAQLRGQAALAVSQYEAMKQQAAAAGIKVQ